MLKRRSTHWWLGGVNFTTLDSRPICYFKIFLKTILWTDQWLLLFLIYSSVVEVLMNTKTADDCCWWKCQEENLTCFLFLQTTKPHRSEKPMDNKNSLFNFLCQKKSFSSSRQFSHFFSWNIWTNIKRNTVEDSEIIEWSFNWITSAFLSQRESLCRTQQFFVSWYELQRFYEILFLLKQKSFSSLNNVNINCFNFKWVERWNRFVHDC